MYIGFKLTSKTRTETAEPIEISVHLKDLRLAGEPLESKIFIVTVLYSGKVWRIWRIIRDSPN